MCIHNKTKEEQIECLKCKINKLKKEIKILQNQSTEQDCGVNTLSQNYMGVGVELLPEAEIPCGMPIVINTSVTNNANLALAPNTDVQVQSFSIFEGIFYIDVVATLQT
jgi:hypothetical protein